MNMQSDDRRLEQYAKELLRMYRKSQHAAPAPARQQSGHPPAGSMQATPPAPAPQMELMQATPPAPAPQMESMQATPPAPAPQMESMQAMPPAPEPQMESMQAMPPTPAPQMESMQAMPPAPEPQMESMRAAPPMVQPGRMARDQMSSEQLLNGPEGIAEQVEEEGTPPWELQASPPPTKQTRAGEPIVVAPGMGAECAEDDAHCQALADFQRDNNTNGFLKVRVTVARGAIPSQNAIAQVSKIIGGEEYVFATMQTDENGLTQAIPLPTPPLDESFIPGGVRPYQTYRLQVEKPGYRTVVREDLPVFPGVVSLQPVNLQPLAASEIAETPDVSIETEPDL